MSTLYPGFPALSRNTDNTLCMDQLSLAALAKEHGTPLFVYSQASMRNAVRSYQQGFEGRNALVCYAMKANSNLAVLQVFAQAGCGFDTVSAGEIQRALAAGAKPENIIFSGVGKTRAEMRYALQVGIGCFNVESLNELGVLNTVAWELGMQAPISIRVNPNVDAGTHPYISTGLKDNKFGIAHEQALEAYQLAHSLPGLRVVGIDCHIGSQITQTGPFVDAAKRLVELIRTIEEAGITLEHIDLGGGLGITYSGEEPPAARDMLEKVLAVLDENGLGQRKLVVEPGRSLVGNAGVCLTEVVFLKHGETKNFCIVDAAMNDLPRPAMYEAFHRIEPVQPREEHTQLYDIVGPICESGDWLGRERELTVHEGDLLAVLSAGAYCSSMSSNYNSRPRAAEVLIADGQAHLVAEREQVQDLFAREKLL